MIEYDFEPPFEVGEYKDIKLRVYLPKENNGEHLADEFHLAVATAIILNKNYKFRKDTWPVSALWYAPVMIIKSKE